MIKQIPKLGDFHHPSFCLNMKITVLTGDGIKTSLMMSSYQFGIQWCRLYYPTGS
jgi:hypothetical protein